ncbi:2Fe-2S iron-sulfur cluster-binding protein [Halobacteriovorax sp. HLS]|uniref:2Fe-2S iron-sulfur cluster-binding protein n=1 Tax=Halobacteriovorax sp. HLS TaxID=2234000 RepID=UPI000FDBCCD4|nr:2Fe-2S iron-sulfur cluster-binding protein [Halobacteriovorax sp. HLS]
MFIIEIFGNASQSTVKKLTVQKLDYSLTLLTFLRNNSIPVASSCNGEGVCKKCLVNTDIVSCELKMSEIKQWQNKTIIIDYL